MLPLDIMRLIDNYNEHDKGFFFQLHDNVYWFNGKRYEKYCKPPKWLYGMISADIDVYLSLTKKRLKWKKQIVNILNKEYCVWHMPELFTIFRIPKGIFSFNGRFQEVYNNNTLFLFSNSHNQKYDFQSETWCEFANLNLGFIDRFYLLDGLFYFIHHKGTMFIYNPNLNSWQTIDLGCYLSIL